MKEDVYEVLGIATNTVTDENLVVCRKVQDPVGIIWERPEQKRFERMDTEYVSETNDGDTISRRAAIDYFVANVGFHDEDGYEIEDECELRKIWTGYFDGIPPAETKIIRCKDCRRRDEFGCCTAWTALAIGKIPVATDDDDFCSYAEQR